MKQVMPMRPLAYAKGCKDQRRKQRLEVTSPVASVPGLSAKCCTLLCTLLWPLCQASEPSFLAAGRLEPVRVLLVASVPFLWPQCQASVPSFIAAGRLEPVRLLFWPLCRFLWLQCQASVPNVLAAGRLELARVDAERPLSRLLL